MTNRRSAIGSGVFLFLGVVEFVVYLNLPPSIREYFQDEIVATIVVAVAGVVNAGLASLISYWADSLNIGNFAARREQCVDWLLGASSRWGRRRLDTTVTVANTAEGIIGVLAGWRPPTKPRQLAIEVAVAEARDNLIRNVTDEGLPSVSLGRITTHCTAMGLFALERISRQQVLRSTPEHEEAKQKLRKALLAGASLDGWAFGIERTTRREDIRVFSTLWAIRALAATGDFGELDVARLLRTVSQSHFGFKYSDDTQRLCIIALYALVVNELPEESLRQELHTKESKTIRRTLFRGLRKNTWTEAEVFTDPVEKRDYSWRHFSGALALGALAAAYSDLSVWESMRLRERWHKAFRNDWHRDGFFLPDTDDHKANPQTFPTTYYADALGRYLGAPAGRTGDGQ
jgi:hypothetical protein